MKVSVKRRDPEIRWYFPIWCHHHGSKMHVQEFDPVQGILVLSASAARLTVKKSTLLFPDDKPGWYVEWEVIQNVPYELNTRGRVWFKNEDLASAFGLSELSGIFGDSFLERYGGDVAEQGKYIRWREFLNIPCPGTGHDGDPNISIHIDERMKECVRELLNLH